MSDDFSLTSDDFHLIVEGLGHLAECDCLGESRNKPEHVFELLKKIELITRGERTLDDLEHLGDSWSKPIGEWDKEL